MKQKLFFSHVFHGTLAVSLAAGLVLSQPIYGNAETSNPAAGFEEHVLSRVDQTTESGLVRSHLIDSRGNIYTDDGADRDTSSRAKNRLKKAEPLPATYDLRNYNLTTSIKDQGVSGCCWAFSAIKAMESNGIKAGLLTPENADLSENHLTWFSYGPSEDTSDPLYGDGISTTGISLSDLLDYLSGNGASSATFPYDNGGSAPLATFTLAKWSGPELESAAPFDASTQANLNSMAADMAQKNNLRYSSYFHMQNAISFDENLIGEKNYFADTNIISEMKQAVIDHGAMSVAMYFARKNVGTSPNGTSYYQADYSGEKAIRASNHCVTIIGWDDNYSKSNFNTTPPGDGAWLIANSYGTEFGDEGYFWLSYYDQSISDCYTFQLEPANNYDHILQYDGFGWGSATYSKSYNIKAANIFTADAAAPQQLRAVSFYTLTDDQQYKIEVYRGVSSAPTNGTPVSECTTTGTMEHNGYHTVPLAVPVNIGAGEKFSVVITYIQSGSSTIYVPYEGRNIIDSSLTIKYSSQKGQSFLFTKTTKSSSRRWYDMSSLGYNNVCIKAFTNNTDSASDVPSVAKKITLGKGESYQLNNEGQTYASNDPSLLSVSDSGKITAKAVGTSSVTVSDGESSSLVQVNVKKAPSSVRLKPSGKKRIKKGKSFRLKVKLPSGSASHKITYRSSRKKIVSVTSDGKATARRKGKAVITVRTFNGKKARLKVTVQ